MIYKLEEGVFFSKLVCSNKEKTYSIDSRTSDAVAIALRFGCPIYITEEILEKAGITISPSDGELTSPVIPTRFLKTNRQIRILLDEELYKMIDEAVKTEDYERAASIRDEIEKRNKKKS